MKKLYVILIVVLASLVVASVAIADGATAGAPRVTTLSGAEEAPGPGDPDGSGFASITLNVGQGRVCWELSVSDIAPATAAHIHVAPPGVPGPVVVPLSPPTSGTSSGCREGVNPALIQAIIDFPEQYYVNVHNAQFPGGAVRGQLSNRGQSD